MPVENRWYIEGRVAITRLYGTVTVEELESAAKHGTALNESGVAPVYGLVDMTELEHFPSRLTDVTKVIQGGKSEKLSWIIVYGIPNRIANFLATVFAQLMRTNFKVVNTQEEALQLLEQLEGKMPTPVAVENKA
jgi:hypothetical protein